MKVEPTSLAGVVVLTPKRFGDDRGFFSEVWNQRALQEQGIDAAFVQDNHSLSRDVGVLRGLHCQTPPFAQDKLVRVARGRADDVVVDIRKGSPSYGKWISVELSAENGAQIFVPKGCLHGFVTRVPDTEILYKCSNYYAPDHDVSIRWDDPGLGIDWGVAADQVILSDKDRNAMALGDFENPFVYED